MTLFQTFSRRLLTPFYKYKLVVTLNFVLLFLLLSSYVNNRGNYEFTTGFPHRRSVSKFQEFAELASEMERRMNVVKNVCRREGLGNYSTPLLKPSVKHPPTPNYEAFYFDRKDKLSWCPTYKAASSSWLYNFCILGGLSESFLKSTSEQISTTARKLWPSLSYEDGVQAIKESEMTFVIVRHPFERLLSAYRDKLENRFIGQKYGTEYFYKAFGKKIVEKYRNKQVPSSSRNGLHNLVPDLYHISSTNTTNADKRKTNDPSDTDLKPPPRGSEPTFEEFVKYLVDLNLAQYGDDHWLPYYLFCTPCFVHYDVIAKFETLKDDQRYIIWKAKLEDRIAPVWKHLTKGTKTVMQSKKYFSTISKQLLLQLYDKYRIDFEMFEYSLDDYLIYVN